MNPMPWDIARKVGREAERKWRAKTNLGMLRRSETRPSEVDEADCRRRGGRLLWYSCGGK